MTCLLCEDRLWYLNVNGEWILCPRCDVLRLAKDIKEKERKIE